MLARPFKRVKMLDADEYRVPKRAVASRKIAVGKARRAKIAPLSNRGHAAREIDARPGCNKRTAFECIGRFNRHGVAGLGEVVRSGRPRVYGPEGVGAVIQAALAPPWDLGRLVAGSGEKGVGMGRTRVAEVLVAEKLRRRKQEGWFGKGGDPKFARKRGPSNASMHPLLPTA